MEDLVIDRGFWAGRRVFVTGHTGFKGSWLCLWLQQMEARVCGYALAPPTQPSLFEIADVERGMHSIVGDVRNASALAAAMHEARPEIVFHMAAQPLVRHSYAEPVETYSTNVMGTVHLLEAVRSTPTVRAVVNVTSDKCYENTEQVRAYEETDPLGGRDPYSSSKGCSELVTAAYRNSFFNASQADAHGVALASARAGNVIGGGDWAEDRLIPDFFRAIGSGRPVRIRNPGATRPWQHVLEPLGGYLLLAERLYRDGARFAEAWNFGPEESDARPVRWIVERLIPLWGQGASWVCDESPQPHEANYLKLDCSKALAKLNWRPRWTLAQALDRIVAWHKDHLDGSDMRAATLEQIDEYDKQCNP